MRSTPLASVLLASALVLGLAACGDDGAESNPSGGSTTVADPDDPVTGGGDGTGVPDAGGAAPIQPTPGLASPLPTAIDSIAAVDDSTLELRFYLGVDSCYGLDSVTVDESDPGTIEIEVVGGTLPDAVGQACIEIAELRSTTVTLASPLGDRTVRDASTGAEVDVTG